MHVLKIFLYDEWMLIFFSAWSHQSKLWDRRIMSINHSWHIFLWKFSHYTVWKIQRGKRYKKNVTEIKFWRLIDNEHRLQFANPNRMRTKIECLNKCCVKLSTDSCNYGCNHEHWIAVLNSEKKKKKRQNTSIFFSRFNQIDWNALYYIRSKRNKNLIS